MKLPKLLTFLIPRICILLLLLTALWISKDPLIRLGVIYRAQKMAGARVEIQQLSSHWEDGQVFLKNFKVVDARDPMFNLFQVDLAYLKCDLEQLMYRRLVVEEGRLIGLVCNAPRTESGALKQTKRASETEGLLDQTDLASPESLQNMFPDSRTNREPSRTIQLSKDWINKYSLQSHSVDWSMPTNDQFNQLFQQLSREQHAKLQRFSQQFEEMESNYGKIQRSLAEHSFPNPLRDRQRYTETQQSLEEILTKGQKIKQELIAEMQQLDAVSQSLIAKTEAEIAELDNRSMKHPFEADRINQLLLYHEQQEIVEEIITSFIQFRQAIPTADRLAIGLMTPAEQLDQRFRFTGQVRQPSLLIKKLELEGSGRFRNRLVNFVGTAENLTTEPELSDRTTNIQLRALGKQNLMISYRLDYATETPRESLVIQWPEHDMPEKVLGHEQSLLASIAPNRQVSAHLELEIVGNQIEGRCQLHHSQVAMHIDRLHPVLGGNETRIRLNNGLSQIHRFQSDSTIHGTLDDYQITIDSDLGNQLVELAGQVINEKFEQQKEKRKLEITKKVEAAIDDLDQSIKSELAALIRRVDHQVSQVNQLASSVESNASEGWKRIR